MPVTEDEELNPKFGPYATCCTFCGTYGDESTQDPVSGDGQMCFACADRYQLGN